MTVIQKTVDDKGRLTLGKAFAGQMVIVRQVADGIVEIMRAKAVPEAELWLHKNPKAIKMVMEGIQDARNGNLVDGPDLEAMAKLADEMGV